MKDKSFLIHLGLFLLALINGIIALINVLFQPSFIRFISFLAFVIWLAVAVKQLKLFQSIDNDGM